jgi:hypothetical protein
MFIFLFRAAMIVIAAILIVAGCVDQYGESRKSKKAALLGIIPLAVFLLSICTKQQCWYQMVCCWWNI